VQLPLPPPDREPDDQTARVRMSEYLPDTTARDLPRLPRIADPDESVDIDLDDDAATATIREELIEIARGHAPDRTAVDPAPPGRAGPRGRALPGLRAESEAPGDSSQRATVPGVNRTPRPNSRRAAPSAAARRLPLPGAPEPRRSRSASTRPPTGPDRAAAPARAGTEVSRLVGGRYRILARIGQGGMGKVYKVSHAQLGKTFALKIISEQMAETDEARQLFFREARLASSLSHPNITSVVDFGEDDELGMFMVMELVEGEPLARILHRESRLSIRVACEVVLQVADALLYIHGKNIVHCDIKTENILVSERAGTKRRQIQVKLLDFGLARSTSASRTTSSLSGTPHYVAPERIRGEPPTPASDIYGLGILLYEVLTGKVPWDGQVAQILAGHLEQPPTPPSQLIEGGLDPALENLVLHSLAKTPAARHRDMAAFIYELRTVMDMLGIGRRGKRGSRRRVVIERSKNERDELVRAVFEGCRLPLALVAGNGLIQVANPAFAKFVMGVAVDVEGLTVQSTPLAGCWATFEADLARALGGHSVRRILEMEIEGGEVRRLLMWLDPGSDDHAILGVQPVDL
jgi:tRNA A-37 threonylcarbamoyl transferase component Bud32